MIFRWDPQEEKIRKPARAPILYNGTFFQEVCSFPSFIISHGFSWHLVIVLFVCFMFMGEFGYTHLSESTESNLI